MKIFLFEGKGKVPRNYFTYRVRIKGKGLGSVGCGFEFEGGGKEDKYKEPVKGLSPQDGS